MPLMFQNNFEHTQSRLFAFNNDLTESQKELSCYREAEMFHEKVFCSIDEDMFSVLYSTGFSRPNAPVNSMISSLILKDQKSWSFSELFKHLNFDVLTKVSLGLSDLYEVPFCYATLFNFQKKMDNYFVKKGVNLLEKVFEEFSERELKKLNLDGSIQRTDSTLISSNIRRYSRLQLLIETLIRLDRILNDIDRAFLTEEIQKYTNQDSTKYVYHLTSKDLPREMVQIGELYHKLYIKLKGTLAGHKIFELFSRVYRENFKVEEDDLIVISSADMQGGSLQSPDDPDATYRKKGKEESRGYKVNAIETAHPDNPIQLITDVATAPNNVEDSTILNDRIDKVKKITPELEEIHNDGGYGSVDNDEKMEKLEIKQIQTAIKGKSPYVNITIEKCDNCEGDDAEYKVSCPTQTVFSQKTKKRIKAVFDKKICEPCPLRDKCKLYSKSKFNPTYYFEESDYLRNKRKRSLEEIPIEHRKLRNNVEATMNEFKYRTNHKGKLNVRGAFKVMLYAATTAIAINFGRIFRYLTSKKADFILRTVILLFITYIGDYLHELTRLLTVNLRYFENELSL